MLFLGKERSFLTFFGAISCLLHTARETENGAAEARYGFGRGGDALRRQRDGAMAFAGQSRFRKSRCHGGGRKAGLAQYGQDVLEPRDN